MREPFSKPSTIKSSGYSSLNPMNKSIRRKAMNRLKKFRISVKFLMGMNEVCQVD